MNDEQAKQQLADILQHYTAGSILHLLADLFQDSAEDARQADDSVVYERCKMIEYSLTVVGLGVDAACPS